MAKANVGSLLVFDPATMGVEGPLPADAVVGIVTERGECERERRREGSGNGEGEARSCCFCGGGTHLPTPLKWSRRKRQQIGTSLG